jgi:N-acetyl-gamma-glutamyl-phosphate reductase
MRIEIPLHAALLAGAAASKRIQEALEARYAREPFISVLPPSASQNPDEQRFDPRHCNQSNRVELRAIAHPSGHVLLMAVLDNLGKGAAGAAVQNLNLMLGLPEGEGLLA